jgi:hypothetical protein
VVRFAWVLAAFATVGCGGSDKEDDGGGVDTAGDGSDGTGDSGGADGSDGSVDTGGVDGGDGGDGGDGCDVTYALSNPVPDSTTHFYLDPIEVSLSDADPSVRIELSDASGAAVAGSRSFSADGRTAIFTADGGLAPSTVYTVHMSVCDGANNGEAAFTTSALGEPLVVDLTGATYAVNLAEARFLQPAGVADLLLGSLENNLLVGVLGTTDRSIDMMGALDAGGSGLQDSCTPSIAFPAGTFADPAFEVGPADVSLPLAGVPITMFGMRLSGAFAADGSFFGGGRLEGQLDARDLAPLLGDLLGVTDPDEVCALMVGFGVTCGACDSDGAAYCIEVLADQITATAQGSALECVDEADCHPDCASSTCGDPSAGEC